MYKKSKIITPDEAIVILEADGTTLITLEKVIKYKYLGIDTDDTIYKTRKNWEKRTMKTANTYTWACNKLSKERPDKVQLGTTAWKADAIPNILFGSETLILTKETIDELERTQSKFVKSY